VGGTRGYHATRPEHVESIINNGFRHSTSGRAGGGGVYVNNTIRGAVAEYRHYNPNGPRPVIIEVHYRSGVNVFVENPGAHIRGSLPIVGDTLSFDSLRALRTVNTLVRNNSIVINPP